MLEKPEAAVAPCTKVAERGDAWAQQLVGMMYAVGMGVPEDDAKAVEWFIRAAEQGDAQMQFNLGRKYEFGDIIPQDYARAAEWYTKAADRGDFIAQTFLADMYRKGRGVAKDNKRAYFWLDLAVALAPGSSRWIREQRDAVANDMTPKEIAEIQRLSTEWYRTFKARQQND